MTRKLGGRASQGDVGIGNNIDPNHKVLLATARQIKKNQRISDTFNGVRKPVSLAKFSWDK